MPCLLVERRTSVSPLPRARGLYFLTGSAGVLLATHPDGRWLVNGPDRPGDPADHVRTVLGASDLDVDVVAAGSWTATARTA